MMLLKVADTSSVRGTAKNLHDLLVFINLHNCYSLQQLGVTGINMHVLGWWKHKDDANVLFLKYEDLKKVC